jgi:hypothetical protein
MKKRALVLVFSNLKHDARVMRQVQFLAKHYEVSLVAFDADPLDHVTLFKIKQTKLTLFRKSLLSLALLLRFYKIAYKLFHNYEKHVKPMLQNKKFDLVVANDVDTLPLAFSLKGDAKVIFDAHEYAPRHFEDKLVWRLFFQPFNLHLCKYYIPKVDGMLTVGRGLANEYQKHFNVTPTIITNAARYHEITPSPVLENKIRLVHHGIANASRRLDLMIDMMKLLDDRFTLDLMLMTSNYASGQTKAYIDALKTTAAQDPRIRILPSVASKDVVRTINQYDMGIFLLPPINFNYANTLPNKLFDFIQARLAIAVGPTPEMADIVNEHKLGVVSKEFTAESLADELRNLTTTQIQSFKKNAEIASKILNAEENEKKFKSVIDQLIKIES